MSLETYLDRQDLEFQALEAIFENDLKDLRPKAWKVLRPLELQLTLKPQESMGGGDEAYVQMDMVIKCPPQYPDEKPEIELKGHKGLSFRLVNDLQEQLEKQTERLLGEVMIFDLANTVQAFLYKHNRPPDQSFHEQMLKNKEQQLEKKKEVQRKIEEEMRLEMERMLQEHQAALRSEKQKRKEDNKAAEWSTPKVPTGQVSRQPSFSPSPSPIVRGSPESVQARSPTTPVSIPATRRRRKTSTPRQSEEEEWGSSPSKDQNVGLSTMIFMCNKAERKIHCGRFLGHSNNGSTVYAAMDTFTGDMVAVAEWVMRWRRVGKRATVERDEDQEGEAYLKQVSVIEQEMSALIKLKHPNLIHFMAMRHQYDAGKITVNILMEYSGGINLSIYTHHKGPLPLETLRTYTQELLEALKYLHKNSIVHRDLRASSVFVDSVGRVRLAGYSIDKRLGDLYATVDRERPGVHFSDPKPMVIGRGGQKGDIYQLGLMLLSLILGKPLLESIPQIPSTLPAPIHDFMDRCLQKNERLRWSASQLLEHNFIKTPLVPVPSLTSPEYSNGSRSRFDHERGNHKNDSDDNRDEPLEHSSLFASGHSRLTSEFEFVKELGKGGFGQVLKVKNKLDGRFYAIKRIPLYPKSKMFNRKMKREVKLLSRLNHENVVRYYCSWIEVSDAPPQSDSSSAFTCSSQVTEHPPPSKKAPHIVKSYALTKDPLLVAGLKSANSSLDPMHDIENLVPSAGDESVEWLISRDHGLTEPESSSDEEEEDEADVFGTSFIPKMDDSEEQIVFGMDEDDTQDNANTTNSPDKPSQCDSLSVKPEESENLAMKLLYIQMEYCEKSTLRNCIDDGLCHDMPRVWRLFREIIEGLVHIHGQRVIHRDLKPVNIFLDSNDNVKIGDFGLATTDLRVKRSGLADLTLPSPADLSITLGSSSNDGNLTGKVGTALYVSPEVMQGGGKVHYDQKVDIYSLGIIFFEMCNHALPTGMERVKILNNLRQSAVIIPEDFTSEHPVPTKIIKWLLNHDSMRRPNAKELLASDLLPPPVTQENDLNELLVSAISNPRSSSFRRMLNTIFTQPVSSFTDLAFDNDLYKLPISNKMAMINHRVEEILVRIFSFHGAVHVATPLFMPKMSIYEGNEQCVMLMDQQGGIVMVPMDHRVPFARYICRTNIRDMKRYTFGKAYRVKMPANIHPREITECAFDIITSSPSPISDAEVLTVIQEIINEFPSLAAKNYYICINHMELLRAVLLHCGIAENLHSKAMLILEENMANKQKRLSVLNTELNMSDQMVSQLNGFLDLRGLEIIKGDFGKVNSYFKSITKAGGRASTMAKSGLHDLEVIVSHAKCLGLELTVLLSLDLIYNPNQYSGVVYQVMCNVRKKKRNLPDVLAVGGRYDKLMEKFSYPGYPGCSHSHHGVGISIAFEKLVAIVADEKQMKCLSTCDVVVCSTGRQLMTPEKLAMVRTLREAGFRTELLAENTDNLDDLQEMCRTAGIRHIVIFKDGDASFVKVLFLEQDHTTDITVSHHKLVERLERLQSLPEKAVDGSNSSNQRFSTKDSTSNGVMVSNVGSSFSSNANTAFKFSISFIVQDKGSRYPPWIKRRHEALMAGKVPTLYPWLPEKNVDVLALDLAIAEVKAIQAEIEIGDKERYEASKKALMARFPKQQRKYLTSVFDVIDDRIADKSCKYILLYSMKDEKLRLLT